MSVLDKDIIKSEILSHLQSYYHGRSIPTSKLLGIVQLILYPLKTGCHRAARRWRELPIGQYLDVPYNWRNVYHHPLTRFNKWCRKPRVKMVSGAMHGPNK